MTDQQIPQSRVWAWPLAIFGLAIALRLIFLSEAIKSPLLFYPGLDPQAYDLWGQRIAGGDWLGEGAFYQSPLYPYFLGAFYAIFGRRLFWVYVLQIVIGSFNCLIIYGIGKRIFGKRVGILAGFFAAAYKPFIFYEAELLKTFLEVFLIDLTIYALLLAAQSGKRLTALTSGLLLGLGTLARDNFMMLVVWFFPWLLWQLRKLEKASVAVYLPAGLCLIIGICTMRNLITARDLVFTTSQAGQNFYIGNQRKNRTGTYVAPDFVTANPFFEEKDFYLEARKRLNTGFIRPSEVSNFWFKETFQEIRADRKLFWKRMALKLALFWNEKEIADNESIYLYKKEFSVLLKLPLLEFGIIAPFGLLGVGLALRRKKGFLLAGYIFIYWISVSLFFIFARYRLAVVGPVLVFAGYGIENLYLEIRKRKWKILAGWGAALVVFFGFVWRPLIKETMDYAYFNLGNSYARAGKYRQAINSYEKAIKENPDRAEFWINLGKSRTYVGDNVMALENFTQAVRLAPGNAFAHFELGLALFKTGDFENSEKELQEALDLDPGLQQANLYLEMIKARK